VAQSATEASRREARQLAEFDKDPHTDHAPHPVARGYCELDPVGECSTTWVKG